MFTIIRQSRLLWKWHDHTNEKWKNPDILYKELIAGKHNFELCYRYVCKRDIKNLYIDLKNWDEVALTALDDEVTCRSH